MLLACGWQKCWGWSSSPGLGEQWGTGPPEAPKRGLCVLPSPHPWVLKAPSSPGSRRSCPGGSQALRMREQSLPAVSVVHISPCIQVPEGHKQPFFWHRCQSSPHNLALLPGKKILPGKRHHSVRLFSLCSCPAFLLLSPTKPNEGTGH